jgi:uncharacterized protein (TIGR02677 family)
MNDQQLRSISEVTYLTTENAWRYRVILHFFYVQHERLRHFLFPEEVYQYVKEFEYFGEYTEDQLQSDLKQLVEWKNLVPRQETGSVMTIEEFKKKKFRYQCTPYTIEIERMVEKLQHLGESFGGSLEATLFDRLLQSLQRLTKQADSMDGKELNQTWEDIYGYFRKIVQNASDYIAHLKSEKVEEHMKTESFLIYKDAFTDYLRNFILGLQKSSGKIEAEITNMAEYFAINIGLRLAEYQMGIPILDDQRSVEQIRDKYQDQWRSMEEWFLGQSGRVSELSSLQAETTEAIRRITRFAQRIGEKHQGFRSRRHDYLHLANVFSKQERLDQAHILSALLFGSCGARHIFAGQAESEDSSRKIWQDEPTIITLAPRIRTYREKSRPGAVQSHSEQKRQMYNEYLRQRDEEQQILESLIQNGRIVIAELPMVEPFVRKTLLQWVAKCMSSKEQMGRTERGRNFRLGKMGSEHVTLQAVDGELEMPNFVFEFLD